MIETTSHGKTPSRPTPVLSESTRAIVEIVAEKAEKTNRFW
jgi:hypothetical protein